MFIVKIFQPLCWFEIFSKYKIEKGVAGGRSEKLRFSQLMVKQFKINPVSWEINAQLFKVFLLLFFLFPSHLSRSGHRSLYNISAIAQCGYRLVYTLSFFPGTHIMCG